MPTNIIDACMELPVQCISVEIPWLEKNQSSSRQCNVYRMSRPLLLADPVQLAQERFRSNGAQMSQGMWEERFRLTCEV